MTKVHENIITRALRHEAAIALRTEEGDHTYAALLSASGRVADALRASGDEEKQRHVALLAPAGLGYIAGLWGIWRAGGVAIPLSLSATISEWEYALLDAGVTGVCGDAVNLENIRPLAERMNLRLIPTEHGPIENRPEHTMALASDRPAMILYTSGTTSKPKGVVLTHANIEAQIRSLVEAWHWDETDHIPLFLPLHHIHGIINILSCALWSGAMIEPFAHFEMGRLLHRVEAGAYTVFMAVPTIYVKLIEAINALPHDRRARTIKGFADMRLMVSGSAALPARVYAEWHALTGQRLLERYGMTEIGMALSNPYDGEHRSGTVGQPLPGCEIRLKSEGPELGEIQVRGPAVFSAYWNRPAITDASFDNGWFRTGDMAVLEDGYYRILGRQSVDIIKSGGYKLSALEIETGLLDHPSIRECAVVGIADDTWGETVAVAVVLKEGATLAIDPLRTWCRDRMSAYKIPKVIQVVDQLPRNAMGKTNKPDVKKLFPR